MFDGVVVLAPPRRQGRSVAPQRSDGGEAAAVAASAASIGPTQVAEPRSDIARSQMQQTEDRQTDMVTPACPPGDREGAGISGDPCGVILLGPRFL